MKNIMNLKKTTKKHSSMTKVLDAEKIKDAVASELKGKDEATSVLKNYEAKRQELIAEIQRNESDRTALLVKTDEIIGRGGSIDAVSDQVRDLQAKSAEAEELIKRLQDTLIPRAKSSLSSAEQQYTASS